jgi:Rrf2 family protein
MLSKKTRYAMLALIKLAKEYGNGAILISDIAKSEKIPQRFLEGILLDLKKIGILESKVGKSGGYFLAKNPESISLGSIVNHLESTASFLYCVSENSYQPCEFCKDETSCNIRKVFKEISDHANSVLNKTMLKDLIN